MLSRQGKYELVEETVTNSTQAMYSHSSLGVSYFAICSLWTPSLLHFWLEDRLPLKE